MSSSGSDDGSYTVPTGEEILGKDAVEDGTYVSVFQRGFRATLYSITLLVVSVITGFVEILQNYLRTAAGGIGDVIANFLGGIARLIREGAMATANNFLLPAGFGFLEGLLWTLLALWVFQNSLDFFGTDVFGLPGFEIIPWFGGDDDEEME